MGRRRHVTYRVAYGLEGGRHSSRWGWAGWGAAHSHHSAGSLQNAKEITRLKIASTIFFILNLFLFKSKHCLYISKPSPYCLIHEKVKSPNTLPTARRQGYLEGIGYIKSYKSNDSSNTTKYKRISRREISHKFLLYQCVQYASMYAQKVL